MKKSFARRITQMIRNIIPLIHHDLEGYSKKEKENICECIREYCESICEGYDNVEHFEQILDANPIIFIKTECEEGKITIPVVKCRNREELDKYTEAVKHLMFQLCTSSFGNDREVRLLFSKCPNIFYDIAIDLFMSLRWKKLDEAKTPDEQRKYIRLNQKENLRVKRDEILSQHYGNTKEKIECKLNDYILKKEDKIRNAFSDNRGHESIMVLCQDLVQIKMRSSAC